MPVDYNNAKARVCEYEVLGVNEELTEKLVALYQLQGSYKYSYSDEENEYDDHYGEEE